MYPLVTKRLAVHVRCLLCLALILISTGPPASAWTSPTGRVIVARAAGTLPSSFRRVLVKHRKQLYRGAESITPSPGTLSASAGVECAAARRLIDRRAPFGEVAYAFGRIGAVVMATADPYLASSSPHRNSIIHQGFTFFAERQLHLIPFTLEDPGTGLLLRNGDDLGLYLDRCLSKSADYMDILASCHPDVERHGGSWTHFDNRSTPFAVASLSVSRAASRVATVWQWVWAEAGGSTVSSSQESRKEH